MEIGTEQWHQLRTAISGHALEIIHWHDSYSKGQKVAYSRCTLEMDLLAIEKLTIEERWHTLRQAVSTYMQAENEKTEYGQGRKIGFSVCLQLMHDIESGKGLNEA